MSYAFISHLSYIKLCIAVSSVTKLMPSENTICGKREPFHYFNVKNI